MAEKINSLIEEIKGLTVLELSDLVKALEEEFGVSAAAPVAVAAAPGAAADGGADEQTEFDVILKDAGQAKMPVIKLVREITGLGLKESKELVDNAPNPVKEGLDKDAAETLVKQLEEAGASVELK